MVIQRFLLSSFFLFVYVCSIEGYQLKRNTLLTTDECMGKPCSMDKECCLPKLICNSKNECGILTWPELRYRLKLTSPCPSIFKKRCEFDIDCAGCKTHKLKCEENECVKDRSTKV